MAQNDERKMGLPALTGMVVGSMIGAGIFSLPRAFGGATGIVGAAIAWTIAATGMYALARVFQILSEKKPELDAGVFAYAKAGFGDYPGFLAAFGYWIGGCIGSVSYWVLIKSILSGFIPFLGDGNSISAILVASMGIWSFHYVILKGVQQAALINVVVTVTKIIPIILFIIVLIFAFNADLFKANLWGSSDETGLFAQVRATMLVTVFVFVGIEGASVYSRYAAKRSHVGMATLIGFAFVLCLLIMVTLLPYSVMEQGELVGLRQPSMAGVLAHVVGPWGAVFVSAGLLISVLGAYLAWSLICAEVLYAAAKSDDMPRIFLQRNANGVPAKGLWLSNLIVELLVISTFWSNDAFTLMINLTSVMVLIPYLLVAGYGVSLALGRVENPLQDMRRREMVFACVALVYTAFMVAAGGVKFMLLSALLYAPGTALYFWARSERKLRIFTCWELLLFVIACVGCVTAIIGLVRGSIRL